MNYKHTVILGLVAVFAASTVPSHSVAGGHEKAPRLGTTLDLSRVFPNQLDVQRAAIAPSPDGDFQMKLIGTKFAAVFDKDGKPLAIFDLSMNTLSTVEIYLGAVGFGDLNLGGLLRLAKKHFKNKKKGNDPDLNEDSDVSGFEEDISFKGTPEQMVDASSDPAKAMDLGKNFFKDLRFTKVWADRNGVTGADETTGIAFQPKTFRLTDIQMPSVEAKDAFEKPFAYLGSVLYGEELAGDELQSFLHEFEFRFDAKMPGYLVVWRRDER
jgi:hypothetical protein